MQHNELTKATQQVSYLGVAGVWWGQDSRIWPLFLNMLLNHAIVKNDFKTQQK